MYGSFLVDPTKGSEPICSWVCNFPMDVIHPPTPTSHWGWKKVSSAAVGGHVHARGNELGLIHIYTRNHMHLYRHANMHVTLLPSSTLRPLLSAVAFLPLAQAGAF